MADNSDPISMADQSRGWRDRQATSDDSNGRSKIQSPATVRQRIFSGQKTVDDILIKNTSLPHQICKANHSKSIDPSPIDIFLKTDHSCRLCQSPLTAFFFKSSSPIMVKLIFSLSLQIRPKSMAAETVLIESATLAAPYPQQKSVAAKA
ncbi:hypothetical protein ACLOJK_036906 [Asimina triloba]